MTANRDIVARAFADWSAGTGAISDIFAPRMRWEVVGNSVVAGTYHSADDFLTQAMRPFNARFDPDSPYRPVNLRAIYEDADANTVVAVFDGAGVTRDGSTYENTYAWILTFSDGKVVDGTAFFDSLAFNELWKTPPAA
ncbi:nuclear transport factor 2 family protein [Micromonospora sp. WMMD812]|uniref:nuclear transport factor 2 family protein n=1 Tax=Micromonospora sp. WMMD812 TaxID=3015152 RepID=UPI00248C7AE2|nr:nuclear transport factor 2 family protein [Micromonospora sp. WMMD812]WBB68012.1 nuclear transport factor 2 family protein [Micromonospora sp. WMMD812]